MYSCTLHDDGDISFQDGATPLFLAAQQGHVTVVRQLISSGAKVNHPREVSECVGTLYGHQPVSLLSRNVLLHLDYLREGWHQNKVIYDGAIPLFNWSCLSNSSGYVMSDFNR